MLLAPWSFTVFFLFILFQDMLLPAVIYETWLGWQKFIVLSGKHTWTEVPIVEVAYDQWKTPGKWGTRLRPNWLDVTVMDKIFAARIIARRLIKRLKSSFTSAEMVLKEGLFPCEWDNHASKRASNHNEISLVFWENQSWRVNRE